MICSRINVFFFTWQGELLKRKNSSEISDESPSVTSFMRWVFSHTFLLLLWIYFLINSLFSFRNADGAISGHKKSDLSKAPRFTRMDKHYPVTKTSRLLCRKENPKVTRLSFRSSLWMFSLIYTILSIIIYSETEILMSTDHIFKILCIIYGQLQENALSKCVGSLKNSSLLLGLNAKDQVQNSWYKLFWMSLLDSIMSLLF